MGQNPKLANLIAEGEGESADCLDCFDGQCELMRGIPTCIRPHEGEGEGEGEGIDGGEGEGPVVACTFPEVRSCRCEDNSAGIQRCDEQQREWGACECRVAEGEGEGEGTEGEGEGSIEGEGEGEGSPQLARYGEVCTIGSDCVSGICFRINDDHFCSRECAPEGEACLAISEVVMDCIERLCQPHIENCEGLEVDGACVKGTGVCQTQGTFECNAEGNGLVCNADNPLPPAGTELCANLLDDDCDGETDEGFLNFGNECEAGIGVCRNLGQFVCSEDLRSTACNAIPGIAGNEFCGNVLDEDCDGALNNGFAINQPCVSGIGICERAGVLVCNETGDDVACDAVAGNPAERELCDTLDNDCDGETDEQVDQDGDTFLDIACGGRDCNDQNPDVKPGVVESCENEIDDNCDGLTDGEDREACAPCDNGERRQCGQTDLGVCEFGAQECVDFAWGPCVGAITPSGESCDELDNDCDGEADNGFALDEPCHEGIGICQREGVTVCDADGDRVVCDAVPGDSLDVDLCANLLDDDCDGQTDEGFPNLGNECEAGIGVCRNLGQFVCTEDLRSAVCNARAGNPGIELCGNNVDEDCDGVLNNGFTLDTPCSEGRGICERNGVTVCNQAGDAVVCDAIAGEPEAGELCGNDLDEDCDGVLDNGFALGDPCIVGQGECRREGELQCSENRLQAVCSVQPGEPSNEECNGLDDDCDGNTDNGAVAPVDTCPAVGVCADGVANPRCTGEDGWVCDFPGAYQEVETRCNALDDDCDGGTDEDFPTFGNACSSGQGICRRDGNLVCNAGQDNVVCNAQPGNAGNELCGNALDDDCDGQTDEEFNVGNACSNGVGACERGGNLVCTADRTATECDAVAGAPVAEICGNNADDDCDSDTDEGFPTVGQPCSVGEGECRTDGQVVCAGITTTCNVVQGEPVAERCNALDDDCDGGTDEDFPTFGNACSSGQGICRRDGNLVCNAGQDNVVCNAQPGNAGNELCGNALDDDCDGQTDEEFNVGNACSNGVGACARNGNFVCTADRTGTECNVAAGNPSAEVCNNIDDDCDGVVDDNLTEVYINSQGGYCIDLYEASIVNNAAQSAAGVLPASNVSWNTANAACVAAGKRLCSKAEWCVAGGADANCAGRTYPWGEAALNCTRANYVDCGSVLKVTGNHPTGISPSGVHDLVGNVWEWTFDQRQADGFRLLKGGGFQTGSEDASLVAGLFAVATNTFGTYGFRCCRDD